MLTTLASALSHRRLSDFALDTIFGLWLLHVIITGNVVPAPVSDLLSSEPPIAVVTEPLEGDQLPDGLRDEAPET